MRRDAAEQQLDGAQHALVQRLAEILVEPVDDRPEDQAVEGRSQILGLLRAHELAARLTSRVQLDQPVERDPAHAAATRRPRRGPSETFAISRKIAR